MKILRQNNYSYHEAISRFIHKKGSELSDLERARVTDALEGKIERKRRRQARRAKNVGKARVNILGAGKNTEKLTPEQRLANTDTFNRQEEEMIKRQTKKLKL